MLPLFPQMSRVLGRLRQARGEIPIYRQPLRLAVSHCNYGRHEVLIHYSGTCFPLADIWTPGSAIIPPS